MLVRAARNDFDNDNGQTWTLINRWSHLPLVDAHCHVFGQSLIATGEIHPWSDPNHVTFVKKGTDGAERKLMKPSVLLLKKSSGKPVKTGLDKMVGDAQEGLDQVREAGESAAGEVRKAASFAVEVIRKAIREADRLVGEMSESADNGLDEAKREAVAAIRAANEEAKSATKSMEEALTGTLGDARKALDDVKNSAGDARSIIEREVGGELDRVDGEVDKAFRSTEKSLDRYKDDAEKEIDGTITPIRTAWKKAADDLRAAIQQGDKLAEAVDAYIQDDSASNRSQVESQIGQCDSKISTAASSVEKAVQTTDERASHGQSKVQELWRKLRESLDSDFDKLQKAIDRAGDKAGDAAGHVGEGQKKEVRNAAGALEAEVARVRGTANSAHAAISSVAKAINDAADEAMKAIRKAVKEARAIADSVVESVEEAVDLARSVIETGKKAVEDAGSALESAGISKDEMSNAAEHAKKLGSVQIPANMDKLYARAVVEVPENEWPPKASTKKLGDRVFFQVNVSEAAEIHSKGRGGGAPQLAGISWLAGQIEHGMAKFVKYFTGDDGKNARNVVRGIPREGGRAAVPYLLDLGYTPLNVPTGAMRWLVTAVSGLPDAMADPDGYYQDGAEYIWFDRDGFEMTYETLAEVALENPYELWPMLPFDPRRPDALTHVKRGIGELGMVGVKLYSRCGWMPTGNFDIHGCKGMTLDRRLEKLYSYLEDEDLPVVNHTSPGGFPENATLVYPKLYDSGTLYHCRLLYGSDKTGVGPLPTPSMLKEFLPKNIKESAEDIASAGPTKLRQQSRALGSSMLGDLADLAEDAKKSGMSPFHELTETVEKARSVGDGELSKLAELADPGRLADTSVREQIGRYINPDRLKSLTGEISPKKFFSLASSASPSDLPELLGQIDPSRSRGSLSEMASTASDTAKKAGSAVKKLDPIGILFDAACKLVAMIGCYEAAKFCHYVQHTVSPYAWEDVLKDHPRLRINFAHLGSGAGIATHFDMDLTVEEAKETGNRKKIERAQRLKRSVAYLHKQPVCAGGAKFKDKLFARCVEENMPAVLFTWFGTGEDAIDPLKTVADPVTDFLKKVLPGILSKIFDRFTLQQVRDGAVAKIPQVLEMSAWREWLDDWAKKYDKSWFAKIEELMEKYDNVYADIAYLTGESQAAFSELMRVLIAHAMGEDQPDDEDDDEPSPDDDVDWSDYDASNETILASRLMIGTDWMMTVMDDIEASTFWSWVQDTLTTDHPLWERWASRNAIDWINLGEERMDAMEERYKARHGDTKPPDWWLQLKGYYRNKDL